jgi:peptide/nickel transport system substrate-binding protein
MVSTATKIRLRRHVRRGQQQVENLGAQAGETIDQHIIGRFSRLFKVWRFLAAWLGLLVLLGGCVLIETHALDSYYQTAEPVSGGIYSEGILGDFTTANPIYADSPVDDAVSRLVFASLLTYNQQNQLVGDLADSWSVDSTGKVYTVHLKPHLTWQDGQPLTATDVVFTYQTIQNPDAQSPLNASWQNVTVQQIDPLTVSFTLSNPLSSFPYSLTNGIVPQHLLANIPADELRTASFNTTPVGAGPFAWEALAAAGDTPTTRQEQVTLVPFTKYINGLPKLKEFTITAFHDQSSLITSFQHGAIDGMAGLDNIPTQVSKDKNLHIYSMQLTAANMVFFKTSGGVLADTAVRQALVQAAQVSNIINQLGYPVSPVREPLLTGQLGYNPSYAQVTGNPLAAASRLQQDGWTLGKNNLRFKGSQPLSFTLYAADTPDNRLVTAQLQRDWLNVGADVRIVLQSSSDLESTLAFHNYDALLYGISIGVDPDVFVYWDSSQTTPGASSGLNFSEYKSSVADDSLEAGRTRSDATLRTIKYQPFLQAWQQDAPALGLYQPRFLYLTREPVYGLGNYTINAAADRFDNVQAWAVRLGRVTD